MFTKLFIFSLVSFIYKRTVKRVYYLLFWDLVCFHYQTYSESVKEDRTFLFGFDFITEKTVIGQENRILLNLGLISLPNIQ